MWLPVACVMASDFDWLVVRGLLVCAAPFSAVCAWLVDGHPPRLMAAAYSPTSPGTWVGRAVVVAARMVSMCASAGMRVWLFDTNAPPHPSRVMRRGLACFYSLLADVPWSVFHLCGRLTYPPPHAQYNVPRLCVSNVTVQLCRAARVLSSALASAISPTAYSPTSPGEFPRAPGAVSQLRLVVRRISCPHAGASAWNALAVL